MAKFTNVKCSEEALVGGALEARGAAKLRGGLIESIEAVDLDAQDGSLLAATINKGLLVYTSVTGGGTLTLDTAANIISTCGLEKDNDTIKCYVVNDGNQTVTVAVAAGTTIADTGQTIGNNEAAIILFRRTASDAVVAYIIGA
tara:strand:- start:7112 stop:7543 length:432 start_codon:yes stop_codon:yes gene_type:complete